MGEAVSAGSWNDREMGWVVIAPLSVPCATTPRGLGVPVVLPGLPLPHWISPGPDPSVLPAGTARPHLPAVPARPWLMQAAFPGKPGHFPTGWGSWTGGRCGRGVPAAVLRTPGTGRATRRLPGALLTRRTRSGSGGVGWRLWLQCKRWGWPPLPPRRRLFQRRRAPCPGIASAQRAALDAHAAVPRRCLPRAHGQGGVLGAGTASWHSGGFAGEHRCCAIQQRGFGTSSGA